MKATQLVCIVTALAASACNNAAPVRNDAGGSGSDASSDAQVEQDVVEVDVQPPNPLVGRWRNTVANPPANVASNYTDLVLNANGSLYVEVVAVATTNAPTLPGCKLTIRSQGYTWSNGAVSDGATGLTLTATNIVTLSGRTDCVRSQDNSPPTGSSDAPPVSAGTFAYTLSGDSLSITVPAGASSRTDAYTRQP